MARKLKSFLAGWDEYNADLDSALPFVRWSGFWLQSFGVERRVWTYTKRQQLFPNFFIMIMSPSGFGKGLIINNVAMLVNRTEKPYLSASSATAAALTFAIKDQDRPLIFPDGASQTYNALHVLSDEFQVLMPATDHDLIARLMKLYDCREYSEGRKTGDNSFHCDRTYTDVYVCTVPSHIMRVLPEAAWSEGLMSRFIMVYSEEQRDGDLFDDEDHEKKYGSLLDDLTHDLNEMRQMLGQFRFTEEAKNLVRKFKKHSPYGGPPIPAHPKLLGYGARRATNILKLMMHSGLDRNAKDMLLDAEDYERAYAWLTDNEANMEGVFRASRLSGDAEIVSDVHHSLSMRYAKTKKPVRDRILRDLLLQYVQAYRIDFIVDHMDKGGWIKRVDVPERGVCWVPHPRGRVDEDD